MSDQPLQPFPSQNNLFAHFLSASGLSAGVAVEWLLYIVFAFWALYTLVAIYHWLKYSHGSWVAFPAIAAHLAISIVFMAYALSGQAFFLRILLP